jgi:aerobic-type carbon monoxide dehydrogenase small subunit (CoxS/CutS family)
MSLIKLKVNVQVYYLDVEPQETLLEVLRNKLHIKSAGSECENGICGNCTILVNGVPRQVCKALAANYNNAKITTMLPEMVNSSYPIMDFECTGKCNAM